MAFADLLGEGTGAVIGGTRKVSDINASRAVPQVIDKLIYLNAGLAPLRGFMQKLGNKRVVKNITFKHFETDQLPLTVEASGAYTTETTVNLTAGHGKRVVVGTILLNPATDEELRVTAISTDALTVTRGFGASSIANIADDAELKIMGVADTEGNTAPTAISSEPSVITNVVQTFRQAFELTRRDENAEVYTSESEKARLMKDANAALLQQIEMSYLFSQGKNTSDPTRTAGLASMITTNVSNLAGAELDEQSLNTFLKDVYERNVGSRDLTFFAGLNIREAFDAFARDNIRYSPDDTMAGVSIGRYDNSFGGCEIVAHGLLSDNVGSGASYGRWGGYGFLLNMDKIGRAVYAGKSDMVLREKIETPGADASKWEWLTDEGLYLMSEKCHGIIKGCAALS